MRLTKEDGWIDVTGDSAERDRYLELARQGKAVVHRLANGWFAKLKPAEPVEP